MHEKGGDSHLQNAWQFGYSQLFYITAEDKGASEKVEEQQMKGNIFFPHNMQLIYKIHKIAGCNEEQCKIQKALTQKMKALEHFIRQNYCYSNYLERLQILVFPGINKSLSEDRK